MAGVGESRRSRMARSPMRNVRALHTMGRQVGCFRSPWMPSITTTDSPASRASWTSSGAHIFRVVRSSR